MELAVPPRGGLRLLEGLSDCLDTLCSLSTACLAKDSATFHTHESAFLMTALLCHWSTQVFGEEMIESPCCNHQQQVIPWC